MPALSLALANSLHLRNLVINEYKRQQLLKLFKMKKKKKPMRKVIRRHSKK